MLTWLCSAITVVLVVPGVFSSIPNSCPTTSEISPCTCKPNYNGACVIQCQGAKNEDLVKLSQIPNLCEGHVYFILVHSVLSGIPRSLWNVLLSSETVDVSIKYSNMSHLIPPEEPELAPLTTPGKAALKVTHCSDISEWKWSQLRSFTPKGEMTVVIDDTPLSRLNSAFALLGGGKMSRVAIDQAQLDSLPEGVFSSFQELTSFSVQLNNLKDIQRSTLPKPASQLQFLHLNGNSFSVLPEDLFSDMPRLQVVYLRENRITTLPENLFSLANSKTIHLIDFVENPWICDCKLMRIVGSTSLNINMGDCSSPENLAGKSVRQLPNILKC